jgi:hypothetical protein
MRISFLLTLLGLFLPGSLLASAMSNLCDCLLGPAGVASCKDVESQLALTRFHHDHSLEKGWVASANFSSVKNGRPEDPLQAELFNYLVGNRVAILKSDSNGTLTNLDGILERIDFSDSKSSTYFLRNPENGESTVLRVSAADQNSIEGLRIDPPTEGELQLLGFFRDYGIREDTLAKERAIDQVYAEIKRLQTLLGQADTAAWIKTESRLLKMDSNLISGNVRAIYNDWLEPFNEVQKAYASASQAEIEIKRLSEVRSTIRGDTRKYDLAISSLQTIANHSADTVGRYYQAVREASKKIRSITDDVSCDKVCAVNARSISDVIGLPYPGKIGPSAMPSPTELRQFLKDHPFAKYAQLKEERNEQIKAAFKALLLQKPFLEIVDSLARNTPYVNQTKAIRLLKIFYDANARMNDFPKITAILRNKSGAQSQIEQLRGAAAEDPDLLVSFARRVDTTDLWNNLKGYAGKTNADLFSRMNDAEKRARAMGDLPLVGQTNWASVMALTLVLGGGTYLSYEAHHHKDSLFEEIERTFGFDPGKSAAK